MDFRYSVLAHLLFASEKTEGKGFIFYQTDSDLAH